MIDHRLSSNLNLKDYYEAAMDNVFAGRRPPRLNSVLEIWIEYSLAHNERIRADVPIELKLAFDDLLTLSEELKQPMDRLSGTRRRAELYVSVWQSIKDVILHPPELQENESGG
jgi:hypothetical protein